MKLYFARHGESEANVLKVISNRGSRHGLTEKGRRQAAELASNLKGSGATRVYSSPLLRALQTAEIVSSALGVDYDITDALREFDCGIAEGRSDPESWDLHQKVMENWLKHGELDARIEQGESFGDIQNRFIPFIRSLLVAQGEAGSCILIGHGGLYLCMLPLLLVNISRAAALRFPNAAYVLAEARSVGLVCLDWCGEPTVQSG